MNNLIKISTLSLLTISAIVLCSVPSKASEYNEVKPSHKNLVKETASFSTYENGRYTKDQGEWYRFNRTWSLTADNDTQTIEKILK